MLFRSKEEVKQINEYESKDGKFVHNAKAGRYGGSEKPTDPFAGVRGPGKKDIEKIEKEKKKKKPFSEMVGLYQEKGLKSLSEMFIKEEPDNEQFKKELDDAQAKSEGKKKNPDIAELARGKSGRLIGNLVAMLTVMKGLPFAYNRDLQEDKEPVFDSIETLLILLPALIGMIETTTFNKEAIEAGAISGHALATEIADHLSMKGIPFAEAHEISGKCVKYCEANSKELPDQIGRAHV